MSNQKTRFAVLYDGKPKELISIRERSGGDLVLLIRHPINFETEAGDVPIAQYHISVHESPHSEGTTIKTTYLLEDGIETTAAQFVRNSKEELLCPIVTFGCPLLNERYDLHSRSKDRIVYLKKFGEQDRTTLVFTVVATRLRHEWRTVPGASLATAAFKRFEIGVYFSYMNLPSTTLGSVLLSATSQPRDNGAPRNVPTNVGFGTGRDSLAADGLAGHIKEFHVQAMAHIVSRAAKEGTEEQRNQLMNIPLWAYPSPIDLHFGRGQRGAT
jgi:hypothetical protein